VSRPVVSIGVPVYNGERFLARTLESLLAQTYAPLEVIVCDNASTDRTAAIATAYAARDPRVRYVRNPSNIGAIPNFLLTLQLATGKYFTWTAADDARPPAAIEVCVAALEADAGAVMAHGPIELELPRTGESLVVDNRVALNSRNAAERVRSFTSGLQHVAMLFAVHRRDVLASVTYGQHTGADYLVCLLMCVRGRAVWVPSPIVTYRHLYGATDNPMYVREPLTLRDLLIHRGVRRKKCWMVLGIGICYVWRHAAGRSQGERLRVVTAYVTAFATRFRPHLATEAVFTLFTPVSWIAAPMAPVGRWFKRRLREASSVPSR
jgi:glycosyltransferase involved in cell wall biosynthesis